MYQDYMEAEEAPRKTRWWLWVVPAVVVVALGAALYIGRQHNEEPLAQQPAAAVDAPIAEETPTRNTIEPPTTDATEPPLPPLGASDTAVHESLSSTVGAPLESFLVPKDIVRHFVTTIDNLPRKDYAVQMWPVKPTPGEFAVSGPDGLTLNPDNYARYEPIMTLLQNTDAGALAKVYKRYYPLFQKAYVDLGYPDGYFNDRLIAVIDHLLETPEVPGPIQLRQPSVRYEFADPKLEALSAGQKTLIRMGSRNAALIKLKLRELRREVVKQS